MESLTGDDDDSKVNTYNGQSILVNLKMNTGSLYSKHGANDNINNSTFSKNPFDDEDSNQNSLKSDKRVSINY